jgi:hypothetical protein
MSMNESTGPWLERRTRALAGACVALWMVPSLPAAAASVDPIYLNDSPTTPVAGTIALAAGTDFSSGFTARLTLTPLGTRSSWSNVFSLGSTDAGRLALFFLPNSTNLYASAGLGGASSSNVLPTNAATDVAITYDGGGLRLYLNGSLSETYPAPVGFTPAGPLYFSSPWYDAANASVVNFAVWNRVLSATELAAPIAVPGGAAPPPGGAAPVPEPSTFALLGIALVGGAATMRGRRVPRQ